MKDISEYFKCDITVPSSHGFHRYFWGIAKIIWEAEKGSKGWWNISLTSGKFMLNTEIEILTCIEKSGPFK